MPAIARSFAAIRVGGRIGPILAKRANVQGISVGSTQMFEAMNRAISFNRIKPVDKVFGFDEVEAANRHMASGAHFGKVVIRVAQ
jgi:NADPH:quinone reductase-like Zn-dependent oxidoreductase